MIENIELKKLIEQYKLIETKHKSDSSWIITIILEAHGNFMEVRQVEDYLTSVLMIGDKLICKLVTKKLIYLIEAEVYNVKFASRSVVLKVYDIKSILNSRKHIRYDVYLSASFKSEDSTGECYCVVVNISLSGLSMIARYEIVIGERVNLSIYYNGFHFLMAECSVKWIDKVNENNLYGLEIVDMDEISKAQYGDIMRKLQRKERLLRKKGEKLLWL